MTNFGAVPTNSAGPAGELGGTWAVPTVDGTHSGSAHQRLVSFTYIAPGTTTYTLPAGITAILVECIGPGGGGGGSATAVVSASAASGGGAGGYARKWITSPAASYACVVGAGGAGGAAGANNGAAGSAATTFDSPSVCTADAGGGGFAQAAGTTAAFISGGIGAAGTVGDFLLKASWGRPGIRLSGTVAASGEGGTAPRAGAGAVGRVSENAGVAAETFGGGGSGGLTLNGGTARAGGAGADGRIIVWEYGP